MSNVRSITPSNRATRRVEFLSGTTSGSGTLTIVYNPPFVNDPLVFIDAANLAANQWIRVLSSSDNTQVTVQALQRNSVTLLGVEVLLASTTTANGVNVRFAVIGVD